MPRKRDRGPRYLRVRVISDDDDDVSGEAGGTPRAPRGPERTPDRGALMLEITGRALSLLRRGYRLSQRAMAEALGWPQSLVSNAENGELNLSLEQLDDWVAVLDGAAARARGRAFDGLTGPELYQVVDHVAESLRARGIEIYWGTGRLHVGEPPLVRGEALEALVIRHWPEELRRLL